MTSSLRCWVILGFSMVSWPTIAVAAKAEGTAKAWEEVSEGRKHYNLGEFAPALKNYQEAYRLTEDPTLLFNIGQCQWKLGDDKAALHSYKAYLRNGSDAANRQQVEARIAELEKKIKAAEESDAGRQNVAPPGPESNTAAEKAASAAEKAAEAAEKTAAAAEKTAEAVRAQPMATPTPAPVVLIAPAPARHEEDGPRHFYSRWWFWTAAGVVLAGAVIAGAALAYSGRGEQGDCHGVTPCLVLGGN